MTHGNEIIDQIAHECLLMRVRKLIGCSRVSTMLNSVHSA